MGRRSWFIAFHDTFAANRIVSGKPFEAVDPSTEVIKVTALNKGDVVLSAGEAAKVRKYFEWLSWAQNDDINTRMSIGTEGVVILDRAVKGAT